MKFADKIKYQREQLQLTQQDLADAVGISKRAVAAYESENAVARKSTMRKLAQVLHVSYPLRPLRDVSGTSCRSAPPGLQPSRYPMQSAGSAHSSTSPASLAASER